MNSIATEKHDEARPDVDVVLRDYFQAELPHPWPHFRAPVTVRAKQPASAWSLCVSRLAMAVCVALLVSGYLGLSGYFPRTAAPTGTTNVIDQIGQKPKANPGKHVIDPMPQE